MSVQHRGPHALHGMEMEYHYHPFGDGYLAAQRSISPLPDAFDSEKRLDYDVRTDDNPVYVGFAEYRFNNDGTVVPATTDTWVIQKITYDGSNRVTRIQVERGAWDDRASLWP